jgi:hypothetical protein
MSILLGVMGLLALLALLAALITVVLTSETAQTVREVVGGPVGWGIALGVAGILLALGLQLSRRSATGPRLPESSSEDPKNPSAK